MKRKVLIVIFNIERAREHEWFVEYLGNDYEIEYALINKPNSFLRNYLNEKGITTYQIPYSGKKSLLSVTYRLMKIIQKNKFDIVHAHLFEATIAGMIAAFLCRVKVRIITRHNSDYHHAYFPSAVKYDKLAGFLATKIVAVSENVRNILINWENVPPSKVALIPHGINPDEFIKSNISIGRIEEIRVKHSIPQDRIVIGIVSRFIYWKGVQYIIPAFKELLKKHPNAIIVFANSKGPYSKEIEELLSEIDPASYRLLGFEKDMPALYHTFTYFVHTPVSETAEAFGQTYIEALAAGIPSVITVSGVALEYAEDGVNSIIVKYNDSNAIFEGLNRLINGDVNINSMIEKGKEVVDNYYKVEFKYQKLDQLYRSLLGIK